MTLRHTPKAATWFLSRFGSSTENESVVGDLFEQYQRGRGSIWYWRQVLSIVFVGLYREFRSNKRSNAAGFLLIRALIALPFAPALILIGGMRRIPLLKGEGGPRQRAG